MSIGEILASAFTGGAGGLLGVVGNCVSGWLAIKQKREENEFQLKLIPLQLNADIERTKAEVAKITEAGANANFVASQENDKVTGRESVWALDLRMVVRPICLFGLWTVVVMFYYRGELTEDMRSFIIHNIVSDASMATAWYFGARATDKIMQGYKTKAQ